LVAGLLFVVLFVSGCGGSRRAAGDTITVPRLLGLTNQAAMQALEAQGLQWSYGKSGRVFSKAPATGTGGGALADKILRQTPAVKKASWKQPAATAACRSSRTLRPVGRRSWPTPVHVRDCHGLLAARHLVVRIAFGLVFAWAVG